MGQKVITNRRPGTCEGCAEPVDAGAGIAVAPTTGRGAWSVWHRGCRDPRWIGSPVSGRWSDDRPRVTVTRFSSGAEVYRNARGRCEDAPCCGCCS